MGTHQATEVQEMRQVSPEHRSLALAAVAVQRLVEPHPVQVAQAVAVTVPTQLSALPVR
jgi:hypothetical protein